MGQKFSGEVGQVAGRDVKVNSAQTSVNVHIHSGGSNPVETKFITDRQRSAIARRAFAIEKKTGTDKLMVYRRLMTVFDFKKIEEMPRDAYGRAIAYMDAWLKNGTTASLQAKPPPPEAVAPLPKAAEAASPPESPAPAKVSPQIETSEKAATHILQKRDQPSRPHNSLVGGVVVGALVLSAVFYIGINRQQVQAQGAVADSAPQHCEYDGRRYTVGSIVRQDGLRQRCDAMDARAAAWRPVEISARH